MYPLIYGKLIINLTIEFLIYEGKIFIETAVYSLLFKKYKKKKKQF